MGKETNRSNSSLVNKKVWAASGNYTKGRNGYKIKKITLHHMAGVLTALKCGRIFQAIGRKCSAHYGVGSDGKIGQYVDEANIAYSDGNWNSNCTSVSIEVANSKRGGQWPVSKKSIALTIKLVADIARRNNLGKLVAGKNLTWHSMYASTACPGPYLKGMISYIASEANKINAEIDSNTKYSIGKTYTLQSSMNVRTGAGTDYRRKKRSELTEDGKKHAKSGTYAVLKKGTRVTCQKVITLATGAVWIKIPSGYVCARGKKKTYIK